MQTAVIVAGERYVLGFALNSDLLLIHLPKLPERTLLVL